MSMQHSQEQADLFLHVCATNLNELVTAISGTMTGFAVLSWLSNMPRHDVSVLKVTPYTGRESAHTHARHDPEVCEII